MIIPPYDTRNDLRWAVEAVNSKEYSIIICEDLLAPQNPTLLAAGEDRIKRIVIIDDGLPSETKIRINKYFTSNNVEPSIILLPGGEECKRFNVLRDIMAKFVSLSLNRRTQPVLIFGGGAVLDVGSFASAIYRRGVPFIKIPTTLLSYIDASIGIKTAINLSDNKNLLGTFTPPLAVLLDAALLHSQNKADIVSGLGEIFKLAVGCDATLLEQLHSSASEFHKGDFNCVKVRQLLYNSIDIMLKELNNNIYEDQLTRAVDLGHTLSQALELNARGDCMRHGEAVAIDVIIAAIISARRGLLNFSDVERIILIAKKIDLPLELRGTTSSELWSSVCERTLHRGGKQRIPLPSPLGHCIFINDLTEYELNKAVSNYLSLI